MCEELAVDYECDVTALENVVNSFITDVENQKNSAMQQTQNLESQLESFSIERKKNLSERTEMANKLQSFISENEKLLKEINFQKNLKSENEELKKNVDQLKSEKSELTKKVNESNETIKELNDNFKEMRWALTTEVAEKHDQIQELKKRVSTLEEHLRQADMQTQFKDDIIKELRKELKSVRKSLTVFDNPPKISTREHSPPTQLDPQGLYNLASDLIKKKQNECKSVATYTDDHRTTGMISQGTCTPACCPESRFCCSASGEENKGRKPFVPQGTPNENAKLRLQLDIIKKSLKVRLEELKEQEEITKNLEEELGRTKLALLALQEKYEREGQRCKSPNLASVSDPGVPSHYETLCCTVNKIEETLQNLSRTRKYELSECKDIMAQEIEKIRIVKNDLKNLEKFKSKNSDFCNEENIMRDICRCENSQWRSSDTMLGRNNCNLFHLEDVECFREKAITGLSALEEMRGQLEIVEDCIQKYVDNFSYGDRNTLDKCQEKFNMLHLEFDEITNELCNVIQKFNRSYKDQVSNDSNITCDAMRFENRCINTDESYSSDDFSQLTLECEKLKKDICDQENTIARMKIIAKQLNDDLEEKRNQMAQHDKEMDCQIHEIFAVKEMMKGCGEKLKEKLGLPLTVYQEQLSYPQASLKSLFCDLQEFQSILEKAKVMSQESITIKDDYEKVQEKLVCLEKCIYNKDETLKVLQDTIKVRECQIEELKSKMEISQNQSTKLAHDVEEKCRLIANLQEAVRKCKQFEVKVRSAQVESLRFEICELNTKLKKCERQLVIKNKKMESLHNEISKLCTKNYYMSQEVNIMEPRLKIMYKSCHLFEKMVNDLQEELSRREIEIESLYKKIKELEEELEAGFKKCENRATEDSKCIDDLSAAVSNFQHELFCAQESYKISLEDAQQRLINEREMSAEKECKLKDTICQLRSEIQLLQNQIENCSSNEQSTARIAELECIVKQGESRQKIYDKKISELQNVLECTIVEHEEERKCILEKLCEEKRENVKNKTLIGKLNENMKRKIMSEKNLKCLIDLAKEDYEGLKKENEELKTEIEVRKRIMDNLEKDGTASISQMEELLTHLKMERADLKSRYCNLKAELDKEINLKQLFEAQVEDLNSILNSKLQEFGELVKNYKCTTSKVQQTLRKMRETEENLINIEDKLKKDLDCFTEENDIEYLMKLLDYKTAENAKLLCQLQIIKVDLESLQTENFEIQANKDCLISRLKHEAGTFEKTLESVQEKYQQLDDENKRLHEDLEKSIEKENTMQTEFREKQRELCAKLRMSMTEKNELLCSVDQLQKQLEQICLENVGKEERNRQLAEECSRLKVTNDANDSYLKSKTEKIICNLNEEVNNLQIEICEIKENYSLLNEKYQNLLKELKANDKKKANLEKLFVQVNGENGDLKVLKMKLEQEVCELKTQNLILKDKLMNGSKKDNSPNSDDKKALCNKIRELTLKIKTLEKRVIPDLEQEIGQKNCSIEDLKAEIREANISSQRMRNEALRVIQHTKKYLGAQRCANETLKTRLECSNKRGNILGAENRDLEEQLKAVTRMNEFLLCQLENTKNDDNEVEPRSFSPLPWGCSMVERDTSSSEYLVESGFQSMQQSPTNMDRQMVGYDFKQDEKRVQPQYGSLKRIKYNGPVEYSPCRNNIR